MRKSIFFVIALCAMLSASVYNAAAQNQESREMKVGRETATVRLKWNRHVPNI